MSALQEEGSPEQGTHSPCFISLNALPLPLSSPYLGNFGFILLFGRLEGLVMVPGTVIVYQLPPSLGNA